MPVLLTRSEITALGISRGTSIDGVSTLYSFSARSCSREKRLMYVGLFGVCQWASYRTDLREIWY